MKTRVRIVNGVYDLHEGLHIVLSLIEQKINFHELQILSAKERGEVNHSQDKIDYFQKQAGYIRKLMDKPEDEYEIDITGNIDFVIKKKKS